MDMTVYKPGAYDLTLKIDLLLTLIASDPDDDTVLHGYISFLQLLGEYIKHLGVLKDEI